MAKGNTTAQVAGNWGQSGMLGPGVPRPTAAPQQAQSGGYAYPWMQAGKWGQINGYGPGATTPTPTSTTDPAAAPPAAANVNGGALGPGGGTVTQPTTQPTGQPQVPAGYTAGPPIVEDQMSNGLVSMGVGGPTIQMGKSDGPGQWTYDGTPISWNDGLATEPWVLPGTRDAQGFPTLPAWNDMPPLPEGLSYGVPYTGPNLNPYRQEGIYAPSQQQTAQMFGSGTAPQIAGASEGQQALANFLASRGVMSRPEMAVQENPMSPSLGAQYLLQMQASGQLPMGLGLT